MRKLLGLLFLLVIGCSRQERYTKVIGEALPKTVTIYVTSMSADRFGVLQVRSSLGAGVYISTSGHVLTCAHLFPTGISSITISVENYGGDTTAGKLIFIQEDKDLALLKTDGEKTPCVRLADTRDLQVGQEVFAIGAPLGNTFSVSNGIISALNRDEIRYNSLQTNTAINPGNSGGPLLNLKGELVGINSFIESPISDFPIFTGLGFSVESGQILEFLASFKKTRGDITFNLPKYRRDMKLRKKEPSETRKKLRKSVRRHNLPFIQEIGS